MTLQQALQQTGIADVAISYESGETLIYHVKQTPERVFMTWENGGLLVREFSVLSLDDIERLFNPAYTNQAWQPAQEFIDGGHIGR